MVLARLFATEKYCYRNKHFISEKQIILRDENYAFSSYNSYSKKAFEDVIYDRIVVFIHMPLFSCVLPPPR